MKVLKYILTVMLLITAVWSCSEEEFGTTDFVDNVTTPTNLRVLLNVTPNNTGLVTITPNSEGAVSYSVTFGDGTASPVTVVQGQSITHIYAEGNYSVKVMATGITGLKTEITQPLVVSFKAPENLVVTIENDPAISKQVNVKATADWATSYDVYFGEAGNDVPVPANIGEVVSYVYAEPGTYTIRIVAKSAAIQTTEYIQEFLVTAILQPLSKAPTPPSRVSSDVVSIFSDAYTNIAVSEWNPGWGQSTVLSNFVLDGDNILKYDYLNYTGIVTNYDSPTNLSAMEYVHFDYWTNDATELKFNIVNTAKPDGPLKESSVTTQITEFGKWVSVNIPLSQYTTDMSGVTQMLFVSTGVTVFIDNLYFYKVPSGVSKKMVQDFEGLAPTFTNFGNATSEVITNPDQSGINTSSKVAQLTKASGAEVWAGSFTELGSALDFVNYDKISVKTWSPKTGAIVKVKLENQDGSTVYEVDMNTTKSNAWEELVFDFSGAPAGNFVKVVIFFDFGNAGDGSVYYYDDIQLVKEGSIPPLVFESFENVAPSFTNFGNATSEVITNPDQSGINTSAKVAQFTKASGAEVWAGSFFELGSALDFDNYSSISVKTWSPKNGAVVKVKLENQDSSKFYEVDMNTTKANAWENLVFDFSDAPIADYVRVVIFFDFGNAGDNSVYYYDNFTLTN